MTLDKFGRHLEHHRTRKFINEVVSKLRKEFKPKEFSPDLKNDIKKLETKFLTDLSKIRNNLHSIISLNLVLKLNNNNNEYEVLNSLDRSNYVFPCSGRILEIRLNVEQPLNYKINDLDNISSIKEKHIFSGDKLIIYPGLSLIQNPDLYMEIILETTCYYVEN